MENIKYIVKRLKTIDWKKMNEKIRSINKKTGIPKMKILVDMQQCAIKYGAGYMDYDLFEMYNLNAKQRDTYLTRGRNNDLVTKYCDKSYLHYFQNKDEFNERFQNYLKRDWISVNKENKEDVIKFMQKHKEFMAKPISGSCWHGIKKVNINNYKSTDEVYEELTENNGKYELEEIIKQHPEVSKIYPDSINTIRVVTIVTTKDGKPILTIPKEERANTEIVTHIVSAYFRIGNGKYVDNFNSGGMVTPIDEKTGIVAQVALDKQKNVYENHPQTGTKIKGFQVPYWSEVIELCKKASKEVPEMGYTGWDIAITPDGPLFVEGNEFPGHDIYQLPEHTPNKIGIMPKFQFN